LTEKLIFLHSAIRKDYFQVPSVEGLTNNWSKKEAFCMCSRQETVHACDYIKGAPTLSLFSHRFYNFTQFSTIFYNFYRFYHQFYQFVLTPLPISLFYFYCVLTIFVRCCTLFVKYLWSEWKLRQELGKLYKSKS